MIRTTTQCDQSGHVKARLVSEYRRDSDHIKFQADCVSCTVSIEDATLDASRVKGPLMAEKLAPSWFLDSCIGFSLDVACTYAKALMEGGVRLCIVPAFCRKTDSMKSWFLQCVMHLLILRSKHCTPTQTMEDVGISNTIHVTLTHTVDATRDVYDLGLTVNDLIHCLPVTVDAPLMYEFAFFGRRSELISFMCVEDRTVIEQVRSVVRTMIISEFESTKQMALFKLHTKLRSAPLYVSFRPKSLVSDRGAVKTKPVKLQKPLSMKDGRAIRRQAGTVL